MSLTVPDGADDLLDLRRVGEHHRLWDGFWRHHDSDIFDILIFIFGILRRTRTVDYETRPALLPGLLAVAEKGVLVSAARQPDERLLLAVAQTVELAVAALLARGDSAVAAHSSLATGVALHGGRCD